VVLTFLSLRGAFGLFDDAVFGSILVAIMLLAPDGVFSLLRHGIPSPRGLSRRVKGGQ